MIRDRHRSDDFHTGTGLNRAGWSFGFWIGFVLLAGAVAAIAQGVEDYERAPIRYSATSPREAISRLQERLISGDLKFQGTDREVVLALLRELRIPVESQLLVFSKTSLQRSRIDPQHPRAIYFSDTCYVGWVPGGLVEVASLDPDLGPVFYRIDPHLAAAGGPPALAREDDCLRCHGGAFVRGIPAILARSVFPDRDGEPMLQHGSELVDFRTPFTNRWGGWYVTGRHGQAAHRGNVTAEEKGGRLVQDVRRGSNVTGLSGFFDTGPYPVPTSDIVALMVFEHQVAMHNALTRAAFNCRRLMAYQENLQRELQEPVSAEPVYDSVKRVFDHAAQDVVDALLFRDEAPLPAGVRGSEGFAKAFRQGAIRAPDGSSLKDLELSSRLFRNRCSSLIYTESFLRLPGPLKRRVYDRLGRALDGSNPDPRYAYLGPDERLRIGTILRETHPDLRDDPALRSHG